MMKKRGKNQRVLAKEHVIVLHHRLTGDYENAKGLAKAIGEKCRVPVVVRDIRSRSRLLDPAARLLLGSIRKLRSDALKRFLFRLFFHDKEGEGLVPTTLCIVSTLGAGETPNAFYSAATGAIGVHLGRPKRVPHDRFDLIIAHQGHEANDCELALPISPSLVFRRSFPSHETRKSLLLALGGNASGASFPDNFWPDLTERALEVSSLLGVKCVITTSPRTGTALEASIEARIREVEFKTQQLVMYGRGQRTSLEELLQTTGLVIVSADSVSMISAAIASGARVAAAYWSAPPASPRISRFLQEQHAARRLVLWDLSNSIRPDFDYVIPMEHCWSDALWPALADILAERCVRCQAIASPE